ncbi:MAG: DUF951 domain-containing protein [Chloroflexota bacterium]
MVMEIRLGDVVSMRKQHPCGSWEWRVVRLGADIGMRCLKCERRVLIPRSTFERRVKKFVSRGEPNPVASPPAGLEDTA